MYSDPKRGAQHVLCPKRHSMYSDPKRGHGMYSDPKRGGALLKIWIGELGPFLRLEI